MYEYNQSVHHPFINPFRYQGRLHVEGGAIL